jgi:hypothetical protein
VFQEATDQHGHRTMPSLTQIDSVLPLTHILLAINIMKMHDF